MGDYSSVSGVNIKNFHMAVRIINPVSEGEFVDDGNLELPTGVIKVHSIGHHEWVAADGGNGVSEGFTGFRWQFFKKFNHFDRDEEPILHGSGFETLIEFFDCGPVFRIFVIDSAGHAGSILRNLLVSQRDKKGSKTLPLLRWESLDLVLDFLNAHICSVDAGEYFASSQEASSGSNNIVVFAIPKWIR